MLARDSEGKRSWRGFPAGLAPRSPALSRSPPRPRRPISGPGAGFALVGSFFVVFVTIVMVAHPFACSFGRFGRLWRALLNRKPRPAKRWVKRLVIVGFDGQDPKLTEQVHEEGDPPQHEKARRRRAAYQRRSGPPIHRSRPVAWSSFATGTNPARHNIFDFLDPTTNGRRICRCSRRRTYRRRRQVAEDRARIVYRSKKPEVRLLRKSKPFWSILGEHNIWSTVLRVPITFPPDKFYGAQLSAMCVPGSPRHPGHVPALHDAVPPRRLVQRRRSPRFQLESRMATRMETALQGPENLFREGNTAARGARWSIDARTASKNTTVVDRRTENAVELSPMKLSEWIPVSFKAAPAIKVSGICRMMVTEMDDHVLSLRHAHQYRPREPGDADLASFLLLDLLCRRKSATSARSGLAEDTWALNEGVTDDATFLQQTYDIDRERQDMFFAGLDRSAAKARSSASSTPPIVSSTCSGTTSRRDHPATNGADVRESRAPQGDRRHLQAQRRARR